MIDDPSQLQIPPPKSPLTIQINLAVLRFVVNWFFKKYLPAYTSLVTSEYRTVEHNAEVGGAANSAHVHGLAQDFILVYANGQHVPEIQAKTIYDSYVAPNWPGFTEFESASSAEGYHIHVNLSREITTYAGIAGVAGLGVVGFKLLTSMGGSK